MNSTTEARRHRGGAHGRGAPCQSYLLNGSEPRRTRRTRRRAHGESPSTGTIRDGPERGRGRRALPGSSAPRPEGGQPSVCPPPRPLRPPRFNAVQQIRPEEGGSPVCTSAVSPCLGGRIQQNVPAARAVWRADGSPVIVDLPRTSHRRLDGERPAAP